MSPKDCRDKLRFRLSDASGVLRFAEFEILDDGECYDMKATLRDYLVGRALADVDLDFLRGLTCAGGGACLEAVISEVQKCQCLFVYNREDQSAAC
jgi:hypothetical protein